MYWGAFSFVPTTAKTVSRGPVRPYFYLHSHALTRTVTLPPLLLGILPGALILCCTAALAPRPPKSGKQHWVIFSRSVSAFSSSYHIGLLDTHFTGFLFSFLPSLRVPHFLILYLATAWPTPSAVAPAKGPKWGATPPSSQPKQTVHANVKVAHTSSIVSQGAGSPYLSPQMANDPGIIPGSCVGAIQRYLVGGCATAVLTFLPCSTPRSAISTTTPSPDRPNS